MTLFSGSNLLNLFASQKSAKEPTLIRISPCHLQKKNAIISSTSSREQRRKSVSGINMAGPHR